MCVRVRVDKSDSAGERHSIVMAVPVMFVMKLLLVVCSVNDTSLSVVPKRRPCLMLVYRK